MTINFFLCKYYGNLAGSIHNSGVSMYCCEQPIRKLEANPEDASQERHLPVTFIWRNCVSGNVGSIMHPMTENHFHSIDLFANQTRMTAEISASRREANGFFLLGK